MQKIRRRDTGVSPVRVPASTGATPVSRMDHLAKTLYVTASKSSDAKRPAR
jgi:hypothetical protein